MIKFPGSPPQMGPLCLPDGWPTGFFLPSALPTEAVGVCGGGLPGEHKGPCPATTSLCPPSFPREPEPFQPSLGRAQLGLAAVAGGGPVSPSPELCLWACLPGTDARWVPAGARQGVIRWDQDSGLTQQPDMGQAQTFSSPTHSTARYIKAQTRQDLSPGHTDLLARDGRGRGRLTSN